MGRTRERRERRADKLEEWADGREAKADAAYTGVKAIADGIPMGQPILVGHHSEKHARRDQARIESGMARTVEHTRKAEDMRGRAANIRRQADHAIYDDDDDAVDRLRERIDALEADRARIKAYNTSCRRAARDGQPLGDLTLLSDAQRVEVLSQAQIGWLGAGGAFRPYVLSNLGGNINRLRKRLTALEQEDKGRVIVTRFPDECAAPDCPDRTIDAGETVRHFKRSKTVEHVACFEARQA